jgi:hypothetical protein
LNTGSSSSGEQVGLELLDELDRLAAFGRFGQNLDARD